MAAVLQKRLSIAERLALVPKEERIGPHLALEALASSGLPVPDPILMLVHGYFFESYKIEPRELIGRVCLAPPRVRSEMHYFFFRTDNILPLFQRMIKFGEDFGCRDSMVESIRAATLTTYSCRVSRREYPAGELAYFHCWEREWTKEIVESQDWEFNLGAFIGEKLRGDNYPFLKVPFPNINEIHTLLHEEDIPTVASLDLCFHANRNDPSKEPNDKVSITIKDIHFYEDGGPFGDEIAMVHNCWGRARLAIQDWNCVCRFLAEVFLCIVECICGSRDDR